MTWLEDPPPWLRPAYCFASVIVWTENNKKLIRRWDSERELSLRQHRTRTKNTIDSCINSATDRFLQRRFTKFSEITQCNGHYAVQGHRFWYVSSRSLKMLPHLTALVKQSAALLFWGRRLKKVVNFFEEKSARGDLAWGFSDLEMTWLLYCAHICTWWPASRP